MWKAPKYGRTLESPEYYYLKIQLWLDVHLLICLFVHHYGMSHPNMFFTWLYVFSSYFSTGLVNMQIRIL
jgi:hypothetical protein